MTLRRAGGAICGGVAAIILGPLIFGLDDWRDLAHWQSWVFSFALVAFGMLVVKP